MLEIVFASEDAEKAARQIIAGLALQNGGDFDEAVRRVLETGLAHCAPDPIDRAVRQRAAALHAERYRLYLLSQIADALTVPEFDQWCAEIGLNAVALHERFRVLTAQTFRGKARAFLTEILSEGPLDPKVIKAVAIESGLITTEADWIRLRACAAVDGYIAQRALWKAPA